MPVRNASIRNSFLAMIGVGCIVLLACNLSGAAAAVTAPGSKATEPIFSPAIRSATADASGWIVEILSPAADSEVPAGIPLEVKAQFAGGEAIYARLMIDSNQEAEINSGLHPGREFSLVWQAPTEGKHDLSVEVLDADKQPHSANILIVVPGSMTVSATPAGLIAGLTPLGSAISFVSASNESALNASIDSAGIPFVFVTAEASGSPVKDIALDADGLQVARTHNDSYTNPFRAELKWSPYRGNGDYKITAYARTADANENLFQSLASATITVHVTGIPANIKPIRQRFVDLYSERFSLSIPIPPLARYIRPIDFAIDPSRWVSAVYMGDYLYEIDIMDDARVTTAKMALDREEAGVSDSVCRPMGNWNVLVAFVDYGNTGITRDQAAGALRDAEAQANRKQQEYAAAHGLAAPLVQLHTTPVFISPPPRSGEILTAADILSLTGQRTNNYDLTAEVDLDSAATYSRKSGGLGWTLYGGCRKDGSQHVNFYMTIQTAGEMAAQLAGSLFDHELSHVMGWQHWWPNGDGSANTQSLWNNNNSCFAYLFFGWMDIDGDGIIEILDPNPYGT